MRLFYSAVLILANTSCFTTASQMPSNGQQIEGRDMSKADAQMRGWRILQETWDAIRGRKKEENPFSDPSYRPHVKND